MSQALRFLFSLFALAVLLGTSGCDRLTPKIKDSIHSFHTSYNNTKYSEIYEGASQDLQSRFTKEAFSRRLETIYASLGTVKETKALIELTMVYTTTPLVFVRQRTEFEKGKAIEMFLFDASGDQFRLVDYSCAF